MSLLTAPFANLCLSGGALGADLQWGMTAGRLGHTVIHWSFAGHRSKAPEAELVHLSQEQLAEANEPCHRAAITLERHFPPRSNFVRDLLRRNWFQVAHSAACYAVSSMDRGQVKGGTAWATQMFIDRFDGQTCPCYVYCQTASQWFSWQDSWEPIDSPPQPSGIYAGVGSRELLANGKRAIRTLMDYVPPLAA